MFNSTIVAPTLEAASICLSSGETNKDMRIFFSAKGRKKDFNFSESFNPGKVKTNREKYVIVNQLEIFERIYIKN